MSAEWMKSVRALAAVLLGSLAVARCAPIPDEATSGGLYDSSSENTESVPYEGWFKHRP